LISIPIIKYKNIFITITAKTKKRISKEGF